MKQEIVFCAPIFNFPAIGGPELRVLNTLKALASNHEVNLVTWGKSNDIHKVETVEMLNNLNIKSVKKIELPDDGISNKFFVRSAKTTVIIKMLKRLILNEKNRNDKLIADEIIHLCDGNDNIRIWFSFANISVSILKKIRNRKPNVYLVSDTDSVWSRFVLRAVPYLPNRLKFQALVSGFNKIYEEIQLCKISTFVAAVSEIDQNYYKKICNEETKVKLAYNVVELDNYHYQHTAESKPQEVNILLAGSFGHKYSPMDFGAKWFLEEVWPEIRKSNNTSKIFLVGRGSKILWKSNPELGVFVEGEVKSIQDYLKFVDLSIVPLWFESGTRFKILESVALKVPVVSTTLGVEGLQFKHGKEILIANTPEEFQDCILKLSNPQFASTIVNSALVKLKNNYTLNQLITQVDELI